MSEDNNALLKELKNSPGWQYLKTYMEERKAEYIAKLIKSAPEDSTAIANLQGRLGAIDLVINKVMKTKD